MEKLEVYTSKKKSFWLLIIGIVFLATGIWFVLNAEEIASSQAGWRVAHSSIFAALLGIVAILLAVGAIFVAIKRIIKTEVAIIIDEKGVTVNSIRKSTFIQWKDIAGFSEIKIYRNRIIMIAVKKPEYWVEKETSTVKKKLMQLNLSGYGAPFSIAANGLDISEDELISQLTSYFQKYGNK